MCHNQRSQIRRHREILTQLATSQTTLQTCQLPIAALGAIRHIWSPGISARFHRFRESIIKSTMKQFPNRESSQQTLALRIITFTAPSPQLWRQLRNLKQHALATSSQLVEIRIGGGDDVSFLKRAPTERSRTEPGCDVRSWKLYASNKYAVHLAGRLLLLEKINVPLAYVSQ